MSNDEILRALAAAVIEERAALDEQRWAALSAGTLDDEAQADLEREAPDLYAAFRPLHASAKARISTEVVGALTAERALHEEALRPLDGVARARIADRVLQEVRDEAPEVINLSQRRTLRGWRAAVGVVAAIAAAFIGFLFVRTPKAALPPYSLEARLGDLELRGASPGTGAVPRLGPDSWIDLVLRPENTVDGPVSFAAYLRNDSGLREWKAPAHIAPEGSIRIRGRVVDLLDAPTGTWTLVLIVGRPGALPGSPDAARVMLSASAPDDLRVFQHKVLLIDGD